MKLIWNNISKVAFAGLLFFTLACGDNTRTGDNAGEENRENPNMEKGDETGDLPTSERKDGSQDAEQGGTGADSTTTDSTHITPRSNS